MPYLSVKQGRMKGERLQLGPDTTVIGRDKSCDICLPDDPVDPKISRKHAVIVCVDGRYYIKDGNGDTRRSHNGTKVNGQPVHLPGRKLLKHDDVIEIPTYVFAFHDDVPAPVSDPESPSTIDIAIPQEDSDFTAPPAEKLTSFLASIDRFRQTLELDSLQIQVVETLLEVFKKADRGFLMLVNDATGELDPPIYKTRQPEPSDGSQAGSSRPFSRKLVEECRRLKKGLCSLDTFMARAAMCASLWSRDGKAVGVILVDCFHTKKGFSKEDLELLMGIANAVSIALANAHYHKAAVEWEAHKQQLVMARDVVKSFLPERLPEIPGYEFFASYEPALAVGGDYYDFVPLAGSQLGLLVADVSGHGVPAALVMTRFSAQVQSSLLTEPDLAKAVCHLNTLLQPLSLTSRFITLIVLKLDPKTHCVTLVNAGHPPPLLLRGETGVPEEIGPQADVGPMLGVEDGYPYQAYEFHLQPADTLILFSDGINEAMDVHGRQFGMKRFRAALNGASAVPREVGDLVLRAVDQHAAGCRPFDDMTLVCLGRSRQ